MVQRVGLWKDSLGYTASLRSGRPSGGTIRGADIIHDLVRFCTCCVVSLVQWKDSRVMPLRFAPTPYGLLSGAPYVLFGSVREGV